MNEIKLLSTRDKGWSVSLGGCVMSKDRFQRLGGGVRALNPPAENIGQGEASRVCGWLPGRLGGGLKKY